MKAAEIKGKYGYLLMIATNDRIKTIVTKIINEHFHRKLDINNVKCSTLIFPKINTIEKTKKLFTKNGLSSDLSKYDKPIYPANYIKYTSFYIDEQTAKTFDDYVFQNKTYTGTFEYIDYTIELNVYEYIRNEYKFVLVYTLNGKLDVVEQYCPTPLKKTVFNYKDRNNNLISLYDKIVWIKRRYTHTIPYLELSTVVGFDEDFLITENNERILVTEEHENQNVMIVNEKMKFAGISIN